MSRILDTLETQIRIVRTAVAGRQVRQAGFACAVGQQVDVRTSSGRRQTMTDARGWAESLFELVDRFDADAVAARMTVDGVLISVNDDPVIGRDGVRGAVRWFDQAVTGISHDVLRAWRFDNTVIAELRVTYVRLDGAKVVLPCTNIFELTGDGLISRYQIFMDMTPVFA